MCTWNGVDAIENEEQSAAPLNCIHFDTARAFCRWAGGDLPTEVEWEYAATSAFRANKTIQPWGDSVARCDIAAIARVSALLGICPRPDQPMFLSVFAPFPAGAAAPDCLGRDCERDETPGPDRGRHGIVGMMGNVMDVGARFARPVHGGLLEQRSEDRPILPIRSTGVRTHGARRRRDHSYVSRTSGRAHGRNRSVPTCRRGRGGGTPLPARSYGARAVTGAAKFSWTKTASDRVRRRRSKQRCADR